MRKWYRKYLRLLPTAKEEGQQKGIKIQKGNPAHGQQTCAFEMDARGDE